MKVLKYLIFFLLFIAVLFVAAGFLKPTVSYGHQVEVNKPLKESWAFHLDESKLGLWLKGFKSIDLISGEHGVVGSKYKVVVNPGEGQEDFEMIETINSFSEYEYVDLSFDSDMMLFDQKTTFEEKNGKTIITTDAKVTGKGMMMKSMFALMEMLGGSFQKQEMENIEALKKAIEENIPDKVIEVEAQPVEIEIK